MLAIYFLYIKYLSPGTGPLGSYIDVIVNTLCLLCGAPELSIGQPQLGVALLFLAVTIIVILLLEIFLMYKDKKHSGAWLFYALMIFILPALFLIVMKPRVLVPRYFIFSAFFIYPVLASFLNRIANHSKFGKFLTVTAVAGFYYGSFEYQEDFFKYGRGQYSKALMEIADKTKNDLVEISSDNDFRNQMLIEYYSSSILPDKDLKYISQQQALLSSPEWYIQHSQNKPFNTNATVNLNNKNYSLFAVYPYTAESGWNWVLYRRNPY